MTTTGSARKNFQLSCIYAGSLLFCFTQMLLHFV